MNYRKGTISIITPCHNSEGYVGRLLESVLSQDYPSVEMIAVDDESADGTAGVIESYVSRFAARGYSLRCIRQPHGGQSGAINRALKLVSGEYLVWPDSDDYYSEKDSLSKLVAALSATGEDVGMSRCLPEYVGEDLRPLPPGEGVPKCYGMDKEWLFYDAIWGSCGFWYLSGGYMVKMSCLDRCIEGRGIAHAEHAGQSWQLLLPVLYGHRCVTVREPLLTVVVRQNSHSRSYYSDYRSLMMKHRDFKHVLLSTIRSIKGIGNEERVELEQMVENYYSREYLNTKLRYIYHLPEKVVRRLLRLKIRLC